MALKRWDQRFFESTRGRVVSHLRRRRHTVEELAQELELTDNAIRAHLATLERDGIVRQQGVRRGAGKPSYDYDLTPDAEALFPKAYEPVLRELIGAIEDRASSVFHVARCDPSVPGAILTAAGTPAAITRWRRDGARWAPEIVWQATFGPRSSRVRDLEIVDGRRLGRDAGPVLVVPYTESVEVEETDRFGVVRKARREQARQWTFFPATLDVRGPMRRPCRESIAKAFEN